MIKNDPFGIKIYAKLVKTYPKLLLFEGVSNGGVYDINFNNTKGTYLDDN